VKIRKLSLCNFGIYAGSNVFDFDSEKPVVLIGGMNGRGKTTILEAVLFALYGKRSFAVEESNITLSQYLRQHVNNFDGNESAKVELEFSFDEDNKIHTYLIRREWHILSQEVSLRTIILKDGEHDQLLSDNWDIFIEEILPSDIAPFFFFDGEKISELANSDGGTYIRESIKLLLGINIIETAINDVQRIIKKHKKDIRTDINKNELRNYEYKVKEADKHLKRAKEEVGRLDIKRLQLENKLKKAENRFSTIGGNLALNRKGLLEKQVQLDDQLEEANSKLLEIASGDLPLIMVMPLLEKIIKAANEEKSQKGIQAVFEQLPTLFHDYNKNKDTLLNIDDFIEYVKNSADRNKPVYNLTDDSHYRLQLLYSLLLNKQKDEVLSIISMRKRIDTEIKSFKHHLSINVNEDEAGKVYNNILNLTAELATVNEQLRLAKENEITCNLQCEELLRQQTRVIEKAVEFMEDTDDIKRILVYAGYSIEILKEYKAQLQSQKTSQLALTMSECFRKLASKQNLLNEIRIDEETLKFGYFNKFGEEIAYSSFSAGEKQLLVIAMLWALGLSSKKKFPIIIDTPLARLDSIHRKALITNYFPIASQQVILLSTDEEVYGEFYQLITPHVGKEYTLQYDEEARQSSIKVGYFGGAEK
jgi:DNA sulfur modification protein DndD